MFQPNYNNNTITNILSGWEDGLVGKSLTTEVWASKVHISWTHIKPSTVACTCHPRSLIKRWEAETRDFLQAHVSSAWSTQKWTWDCVLRWKMRTGTWVVWTLYRLHGHGTSVCLCICTCTSERLKRYIVMAIYRGRRTPLQSLLIISTLGVSCMHQVSLDLC